MYPIEVYATYKMLNLITLCCMQAIGHQSAPLKRMMGSSVSWAKLEPAGEYLVSKFIDSLDQSEGTSLLCMHIILYQHIILIVCH